MSPCASWVCVRSYPISVAIHRIPISFTLQTRPACANGHVDCVAWLIDQGVEGCAANESGNSPLHWAVQNQHEAVVRLLLEKLENVDVLARNAFGKSVLTEGFAGKSQGILKLLLEHPSADED